MGVQSGCTSSLLLIQQRESSFTVGWWRRRVGSTVEVAVSVIRIVGRAIIAGICIGCIDEVEVGGGREYEGIPSGCIVTVLASVIFILIRWRP